ncbi:MAG: 50S ribosome-binding GTPase, partial [Spirochaetales bacterium]|nr:50S ribosome-binding GTPase [Spirochaetales bacterium]
MNNNPTIALLGQPNSGKSTLFNALTGLRQHVGNWPGKTVEKKEGYFSYNGKTYMVADLPGSYSMSANSDEEVITRDFISSGKADAVCILADSSQLERSLFMLSDFAGLNVPCFVILNMSDVAESQGTHIRPDIIETKIGVPVIMFCAADNKSYRSFYQTLDKVLSDRPMLNVTALESEYKKIDGYTQIKSMLETVQISGCSTLWLAAKIIENDKVITAKIKQTISKQQFDEIQTVIRQTKGAVAVGERKFAWIDYLLSDAVTKTQSQSKLSRLDKIFTHKIWGKPAVIITVLLGLISSFIPALPLMAAG